MDAQVQSKMTAETPAGSTTEVAQAPSAEQTTDSTAAGTSTRPQKAPHSILGFTVQVAQYSMGRKGIAHFHLLLGWW
jgi:pectin methylesterase-like acyl-CoA thioesterase